jgi:hypothetical protein
VAGEARALLRQARETQGGITTTAQLDVLPEPIRRYLTYAQVAEHEPIRTVRLKQRGAMQLREGSGWRPMTAEQYFTTDPPAFLWYGTIHPFPLVSVSAQDTFSEGHGSMRVRAVHALPLGTTRGPEMDEGELLRYLGEVAWFPTAWLSPHIRWDAIDASRARATISLPEGAEASGVLHVDREGRFTQISAHRYRDEHGRLVLRPWTGRWNEYREVHGIRVPMRAEAVWELASREFSYFRGEVVDIEYNASEPF